MKIKVNLREASILILVFGFTLFGISYFLPVQISLRGVAFVGGLIGYIIFIRSSSWDGNNLPLKNWCILGVTILMSLWASICLLMVCNLFTKIPHCTERMQNGFLISFFFFPMLVIVAGWISRFLSRKN